MKNFQRTFPLFIEVFWKIEVFYSKRPLKYLKKLALLE